MIYIVEIKSLYNRFTCYNGNDQTGAIPIFTQVQIAFASQSNNQSINKQSNR